MSKEIEHGVSIGGHKVTITKLTDETAQEPVIQNAIKATAFLVEAYSIRENNERGLIIQFRAGDEASPNQPAYKVTMREAYSILENLARAIEAAAK